MTNYTPERSLDPESYTRVRIAHTCACCGGEIYSGEEYYRIEPLDSSLRPLSICKDCMKAAREEA